MNVQTWTLELFTTNIKIAEFIGLFYCMKYIVNINIKLI